MTSWIFSPSPDRDRRAPLDELTVTLEMSDNVTVVQLAGPLCAYTAPYLDAELCQVEDAGRNRLVIDASDVRTLSSDGLDVLEHHARRCDERGGDLVIRNPSSLARRVLAICHLDGLLAPLGAVAPPVHA
jgi:anti-anti-sigma factor